MVFSKKWLQNHSKFFLLHFLIHIDVLKLCSKFELIPTSIFQVTIIILACDDCICVPMTKLDSTLNNKLFPIHPIIALPVQLLL